MTKLLVRGSGKLSRRPAYVLSRGNDKIGETVYAFNLPAVLTCPGMSAACTSCYARRGRWLFTNVDKALQRNWEATRDPFFAERVLGEIRRRKVGLVRIHASGDFFSDTYIRRWARVIRATPTVRYWAYTRSWRLPGLRAELESQLVPLSNLQVWYSADKDTGVPVDLPAGVRVAWLQEAHDEPVPEGIDLVFRVHRLRKKPTKRVSLTLVCPVENGQTGDHTDCAHCGVCWRS